ncbi:MAG TPA: CvpA family protein, partial [Verrucomicrobiota bacterium]|nr:CvpA family protein [Verrucomicrobiota bacterium]
MLMWVMAVVLVGGFAMLGFQLGGIRAVVCLVGALLGLALATVLGGLVAPLLPKLGVVSRAWLLVLPAVVGFAIVWLISLAASFAAHRPVELHFKYREDDMTRSGFEKMNRAIGLFVGMLTGVVVLFAAGRPIYSRAYLTTQLGAESEVAPVGYINSIRTGMAQTGWDRTFQPLDNTSPKFHAVADLLGLVYANPALTNRMFVYPPFLALVERSEISDVLGDPEYLKLVSDQAGFTALLNHPKTQAILNNSEIQDAFAKLDLDDLKKYFETGKSPKFDDEKLLGRWRPDMSAIVTDARRRRANLPLADLKNLRMALNAFFSQATLTFYPDGRFALRIPPPVIPASIVAPET